MPTTPTATLHRDPEKGFPWGRQWNVSDGDTFVQSFVVDTDDLESAILASGLPRRMDAFSSDFPLYRCISLVPAPNGCQSSKVVATFARVGSTAWGGAGTPPPAPEPPAPDTTFTEWRSANESVTLTSAVNVDTGAPMVRPYQINGGAGMPAFAGRIELDVWVYYPPGVKPNIPLFKSLHCDKKTNSEEGLALPPTRGTASIYIVGRRELLYMGFRHLLTPTGIECVVHTLWWATSHNFFWTPSKADGSTETNPDGSAVIHEDPRYQQVPFSPLWNIG